MYLYRSSIQVKTDIDSAFQLCLEVENWPKYFPPCSKATILKQSENEQLIEITAMVNNKMMTWQSLRFIDRPSHTIKFRQIQPSLLLKSLEGTWRFDTLDDAILISLEHYFDVKDDVTNLVENVHNKAEAVAYMMESGHKNTHKELNALKQALEKSSFEENEISTKFQAEEIVPRPIALVYAALWDIKNWPTLLPHCKAIDLLYNDGIYQEFIMQITTPEYSESMRSIRYTPHKRKICYFQPKPPPALSMHRGEWLLEPLGNSTRITSCHEISLNPEGIKKHWPDIPLADALERVKTNIKKNSLKTITAIANFSSVTS
jgi:aromatase